MVHKDTEKSSACEVIKGKIYFAVLQRPEDLKGSWLPRPALCFSTENELIYEPFFQDFGPLNIACTYRFCWKLHGLIQDAETHGRCVCYCTSVEPTMKPNAAVLLGAFLVLFEGWEPDTAYAPLAAFEPYLPFRDPTCGISTYHLTVLDCIRAVAKGQKVGWINFNTFNLEEYEYFEQVENGDLNWIVPNKLVAFSGPAPRRSQMYGYRSLVPEDYIEYYKRVGVVAVIRLNKRLYDRRRFTDHGINHYDLYFPDGSHLLVSMFKVGPFSCPPERIVQRFLEIVEETPGSIAVHCKAGLGRTGVLIGCYMMKHYKFTSNEAIGYLRLMRPGSVIGPQQHFLRDMQSRMWKAGDGTRRHRSESSHKNKHLAPPTTTCGNFPLVTLWNNASYCQGRNNLFSSATGATKTITANPKRDSASMTKPTSAASRQLLWDHKYKREGGTSVVSERRYREEEQQESSTNYYKSPNKPKGRGGSNLGYESAMANMSLSSAADPVSQMRKACVNEDEDVMSSNNETSDGGGILRNANFSPRIQAAEAACTTHRTINAAGQPRKMVMPAGTTTTTAVVTASDKSISRGSSSPLRRRSSVSPLRSGATSLRGYEF